MVGRGAKNKAIQFSPSLLTWILSVQRSLVFNHEFSNLLKWFSVPLSSRYTFWSLKRDLKKRFNQKENRKSSQPFYSAQQRQQRVIKIWLSNSDLTLNPNVPLLHCWHQLRSLWSTLQYQCDHNLQLQWVEWTRKGKNTIRKYSHIKCIF